MRCGFIGVAVVAAGVGVFWASRQFSTGTGTTVEAVPPAHDDSPAGRSTATVPDGRAGRTPLPPPLTGVAERVLRDRAWRPKPSEVPMWEAREELALIEAYQDTSSLTNRQGISLALACGGSEAVVPLLVHTLTDEFAAQSLAGPEFDAYLALPQVMGYAARRHAAAVEFLVAACEPAFWENRPRPLRLGNDAPLRELISGALIGLAVSGRAEAPQFFEEVRKRPPGGWPPEYRGPVVDAVFHYRMLDRHGSRYLDGDVFPSFDSFMQAFREWRATNEGQDWAEWSSPLGYRKGGTR